MAAHEQGLISVEGVSKRFETSAGMVHALGHIDLSIRAREFVTIIGRSGCGKTTLLNIFGGLIPPSRGGVFLNKQAISGPSRNVGFVFQQAVMLRWRNVLQNLMLPIEIFGLNKADYFDRAIELLSEMELSGFKDVYPHQLSGGMRQRVAIARSLLYDPEVLLMDEPFGALDAQTREQMNLLLLDIWEESKKTIIFVTHDISEAVFLSDRVVVLTERPGEIREVVEINLPRPRTLEMTFLPEFAELRRRLHAHLNVRNQGNGGQR